MSPASTSRSASGAGWIRAPCANSGASNSRCRSDASWIFMRLVAEEMVAEFRIDDTNLVVDGARAALQRGAGLEVQGTAQQKGAGLGPDLRVGAQTTDEADRLHGAKIGRAAWRERG